MSSETTIKKLKPTSVADWINALKFGGYQQAKNMLHIGSSFCCLGVALDIAGVWWKGNLKIAANAFQTLEGSDCTLQDAELKQMGELGEFLMQPCDQVGTFDGGTVKDYCIYMNDVMGYDFPMIANEAEILYKKWIAEKRAKELANVDA